MDPYSIEANGEGPQQVLIQDGIGRTGGIVLGVVAGMALGMATYSVLSGSRDYRELEREVRLQQLKLDDMRVALNSQGIATNKHAESDSP